MDIEEIREQPEKAAKLLVEIDWNIAPLVKALWEFGITTDSSCEGHLRKDSCPYPFVIIGPSCNRFSPELLKKLIIALGLWNGGEELAITRDYEWVLMPYHVIHHKERKNDYYSLRLQPAEKNRQRDPKLLKKLQHSAKELGSFLSGFALSSLGY